MKWLWICSGWCSIVGKAHHTPPLRGQRLHLLIKLRSADRLKAFHTLDCKTFPLKNIYFKNFKNREHLYKAPQWGHFYNLVYMRSGPIGANIQHPWFISLTTRCPHSGLWPCRKNCFMQNHISESRTEYCALLKKSILYSVQNIQMVLWVFPAL